MKVKKRISMLCFLLLSWLLPFTALHAQAAIYYVDPSGSNSNPGTQGQPWLTLQYAASRAAAGDTVLVNNGTYIGFYSVNSGTSTNPITFQANGSNVIINSPPNTNRIDNINIEGSDYIIVDGFIVQNAPRGGIRVAEATGVIVRNNTVGPCGLWCIFTGFAPEVQILNNKAFGSTNEIALYVSNSRVANDNPVIRGNEVYGSASSGIQVNGDCFSGGDGVISGAIIENNIVHDNNAKGFSLTSMTNSVVQNNISYNNGTGNRGAGGIHLSDQVSPSPCGTPSNNNLIVNNTIVEPRIAGIRITDGAINNVIFNNLVVSGEPITDEVGGNNIDTTSNLRLSSTTGLFINPSAGDYHLASNSPAINAGRASYSNGNALSTDFEGTGRPQGSGYDVGYDEFGAGSGNASPTVTMSANTTSGNSPLTVTFTANASDSDGAITLYEWDLDGNGTYEANGTSNTRPYTYNNTGAYYARVRVTDNNGATTTSSNVTITVSTSSGGGGGNNNNSDTPSADVSGGGGGCGFVKDDNGKGQKAKGEGMTFAMMLIITLSGIALLRRGVNMKRARGLFLASFTILLLLIFFQSYANADVTPVRPRLLLTSSKLAELRAKACYDANGNVIPNCTPQASWVRVKNWADTYLNSNSSTIDPSCSSTQPAYSCWLQYQARNFAIVYQITKDTRYAGEIIKIMDYWYNSYDITWSPPYNNHYGVRGAGLTMGLAYDWVYDQLDATRRANYIAKINQWMLNFTTPYGTPGNTSTQTNFRNGPDYDYYNGYLVGAAAMAYATYGDNPNSQSYIDWVKNRVSTEAVPFLEGQPYTLPLSTGYPIEKGVGLGSGGFWSSGWGYGSDSAVSLLNTLEIMKTAEGLDYFNTLPAATTGLNFLKETPIALIYSTMPNLLNIYWDGRLTNDPTNAISPSYRAWMEILSDEFKTTQPTISRRIQYWLNNSNYPSWRLQGLASSVTMTDDFLWYDSTLPQENYNTMDLVYYALGTQKLIGRSGWGANDTWFTFKSGGRWTMNNDNSQNHFDIYKYTPLAMDSWGFPPYSGLGLYGQASAHNIIINNNGPDELEGTTYWGGESTIPRYENAANYVYIVGNATDVYTSQSGSGVTYNEREFLYIKDIDHFVVFDRYNTDGTPNNIWWLLHSYFEPTIISSDTARIDNGSGRLFVKTLLPQNPVLATTPQSSTVKMRLQVSPTTLQTNNQFLHVLYPTSASTSAMTDTVRINSLSGNMVGAHIRSSSINWVVMFSANATGSNVTGTITYTITPTTSAAKHLILNLPPSSNYNVTSSTSNGNLTVTITPSTGGAYQSSSQGALYLSDAPSVVITSPSTSGNYSTTASTISLSGTSAIGSMAAAGAVITSVTWSNDRGGSGTATGTTSWSISNISLQSGQNIITVTATDSTVRTGSAVFVVNPTTAPPSSGGGGSGGDGGSGGMGGGGGMQSSSSTGDTAISGGGCGFVWPEDGGQKPGDGGQAVSFIFMLIITLTGIKLARKVSLIRL